MLHEAPDDFSDFLLHVDGYLCELKDAQIRDGLHTLGQTPTGEQRIGLVLAMLRLDNGTVRSLRGAIAAMAGLDYQAILDAPGTRYTAALPAFLTAPEVAVQTQSDVLDRLEDAARGLLEQLDARGWDPTAVARGGGPAAGQPQTRRCVAPCALPVRSLCRAWSARQTRSPISSTPCRGNTCRPAPAVPRRAGWRMCCPPGAIFIRSIPRHCPPLSPTRWARIWPGRSLEKYLAEEGAYPESVGIVVWGTSAMRTHGDDIGEVLALLGVRPVWQTESRRVTGIEVIPLAELGRPRIDVTLRISGFFRDAFPNLVHLVDAAVRTVAELDEPLDQNFVRKHYLADCSTYAAAGMAPTEAQARSLYRVFGSKPGTYGAGILPLLDERNWRSDQDLAAVYVAWGGYAYTQTTYGAEAASECKTRFAQMAIAVKNQDNREHDIFDSDDYMQYHGGMVATVRALTGQNPKAYFGDSSDPGRSRVRELADEARRVFRTRVVNPKWVQSMQRHGYKGAFEMAATVDYLFGYDATAHVVEDWMYTQLTDQYVLDPQVQQFFQEKNPWALRNIIERLMEAVQRGLWEQPDEAQLAQMRQVYLQLEGELEDRMDTTQPSGG